MIHQTQKSLIFCVGLFMLSRNVDDGTLVTSVATMVSNPLLDCAANSKSGRRDNASATTLSLPGLYSTGKLYLKRKDSHLAIVLQEVWAVYGRA